VVSRDVGGAFGMRTSGYPEYPAMLVAAKMLGRPVRWLSTRSEGFLTDNQARDTIIEGRLAMELLAIRVILTRPMDVLQPACPVMEYGGSDAGNPCTRRRTAGGGSVAER
jgi:Molybdopterin-binding domain of aldehyde dehydrogenase